MKQEFCPAVIMASIGCILFLFGMINLLEITANALFILGVILLVYTFILYDKRSAKNLWQTARRDMSVGMWVFWALTAFIVIRLQKAHIYDCDNYNHWGLIVKNLYYDNAFPDNGDPIIRFQSYPVGSAALIWYSLRFFKYTDATALIFQDIFMMSCGIGLFAFIDEKKKTPRMHKAAAYALAVIGTLSLFSCDKDLFNGPFDLLVDQMLASIAVVAFVIVEYYKDDCKKALWAVLPLLTFEIAVKNSGILFTYAVGLILAYRIFKSSDNKRSFAKVILPELALLGIPLLVRKFWDLRVKLAFSDATTSIHSVSVENYKITFGEKTAEELKTITELYLEKAVNPQNYILSFCLILLILFFLFEYKKGGSYKVKNSAIYIVIVYLIYQVGLYCMYIFSMPVYEALCMPCYFRYIMTIDQFTLGIILMIMIKIFMNDDFTNGKEGDARGISLYKYLGMVFSIILVIVYTFFNILPLLIPRETTYKIENSNLMYSIFEKYDLPQDQEVSYLIYLSSLNDVDDYSEFTDYQWHMATYALYSAHVNTLLKSQLPSFDRLNEYDYVIIIIPDDEIVEFLNDNGLEYSECIELRAINK